MRAQAVVVPQTNIQLYNELREQGRGNDELVLVRRAYELSADLYAGYYQADGKPFVAHPVGVAGILAQLGQPTEIVAMALIHAVYENADFGDGLDEQVTPERRRIVREAVGPAVEGLVLRFRELRFSPDTIDEDRAALAHLDETDRRLYVAAIADHLEKYVDLGVLYFGDDRDIVEWTDRIGPEMIELARELDEPRLADMLAAAFKRADDDAANVSAELRVPDGRRGLKLVVPRSLRQLP